MWRSAPLRDHLKTTAALLALLVLQALTSADFPIPDLMAPSKFIMCLWFLLAQRTMGSHNQDPPKKRVYGSAIEEISRICSAICSQRSEENKLTFVFVLVRTVDPERSFDFLWELPHAHVYLGKKGHFPMKRNDREIQISYGDNVLGSMATRYPKLFDDMCAFVGCFSRAKRFMQQLHVEKRALIRARIHKKDDFINEDNENILLSLSQQVERRNYFRDYQRAFILVRKYGTDDLLSSFIVKRSLRVVAGQIVRMIVREMEAEDAEEVFPSEPALSNRSFPLSLNLKSMVFAEEDSEPYTVGIDVCDGVSIASILVWIKLASSHGTLLPKAIDMLTVSYKSENP